MDVLVIEDQPYKPYHLVEDYTHDGKTVRAHHIYTRLNDTNIPMREAAPPHEIERMWEEKFGLDKSPLERAKMYLGNPTAWTRASGGSLHSKIHEYHCSFPEFTLRTKEASDIDPRNEEWTRGEICTDSNHAFFLEVYYHQTCLDSLLTVSFDDGKKTMVSPAFKPLGTGRFYFYEEGSIERILQTFLCQYWHQKDDSINLRLGRQCGNELADRAKQLWPDGRIKIPVLQPGELEEFLASSKELEQEPSTDKVVQYQLFLRNQIDFEEWRRGNCSGPKL